MFQNIPIHRILPVTHYENILHRLPDFIKNPDFDVYEFEKYIDELDNVDYTCLANKNINIFMRDYSFNLLEKTAFLIYKTRELNTNVILHFPLILIIHKRFSLQFWAYYIKRRGWENTFTIKYEDGMKPFLRNRDEIYLIDDYFFLVNYNRYDYVLGWNRLESCFTQKNQKKIFLAKFENNIDTVEDWFKNSYESMHSECKKNMTMTVLKSTRAQILKNFFGGISKTACL